jgi:hypothetical protein
MIRMNLFIEKYRPDCNVTFCFVLKKKDCSERQDKALKNKQTII